MDPELKRFSEMISSGEIKDLMPIPNKVFTFGELNYLYTHGYIFESNNMFIAITSFAVDSY